MSKKVYTVFNEMNLYGTIYYLATCIMAETIQLLEVIQELEDVEDYMLQEKNK